MPGAYGEVKLALNTGVGSLIVPVPTMIFRAQGLQVAVVENNKVKLAPITIGQDDGKVIQVVSGLTKDSEIIQNPPDSILDGETVRVVQPSSMATGGQGSQPGAGGGNGPQSANEGAQQQTGSQSAGQQANDAASRQSGGGKQ